MVLVMTTLTLKSIPTSLHEALKRRAQRNRRSLNSEAIACLEQVVAPSGLNSSALLEQIRVTRERLNNAGIAPLTDAFLDEAKREGRS
jgi:plasmid stability protein